jgi:hypothetical protein
LIASGISSFALRTLRFGFSGSVPIKVISLLLSLGGTAYCWVVILSIAGEMEKAKANLLASSFLASYLIDLFIIEPFLIVIKILFLPGVEKKIREKDSPIIYNLLFFMLTVSTAGTKNGFF